MSENELRMVEPEDLYRFKYLLNASLSPDGKTVAYTVTEADAEEMKEHTAIWLCSIETGGSNQFTAGTLRDSNPQWSPDGGRIAFLSTRGEKTQIYVIPVCGGEAQAVTSLRARRR
jgi:Tol biopolymer transport system component